MTTQTETAAWPENVIARYLTVGGATVDVTDQGEDSYWRYETQCTGCPHKDGFLTAGGSSARRDAQAHAERCRAMPKPTA